MAVSSIDAGKTLCELSGWQMSNLRLQKVLYISHMYHLGIIKDSLIKENFEAWEYGPVEPNLYHYCKFYGSSDIQNIFPLGSGVDESSPEYKTLKKISKMTEDISSPTLVNFTHSDKSAWKKRCDNGYYGRIIPNKLIEEEHYNRQTK